MCAPSRYRLVLGKIYRAKGKEYIYTQINSKGDTNFVSFDGNPPLLDAPISYRNNVERDGNKDRVAVEDELIPVFTDLQES